MKGQTNYLFTNLILLAFLFSTSILSAQQMPTFTFTGNGTSENPANWKDGKLPESVGGPMKLIIEGNCNFNINHPMAEDTRAITIKSGGTLNIPFTANGVLFNVDAGGTLITEEAEMNTNLIVKGILKTNKFKMRTDGGGNVEVNY